MRRRPPRRTSRTGRSRKPNGPTSKTSTPTNTISAPPHGGMPMAKRGCNVTTELVPATTARVALGQRELAIVRDQLAPEANPDELEWFAHVANHLDLDPFRG